jgi:hypothetical protein
MLRTVLQRRVFLADRQAALVPVLQHAATIYPPWRGISDGRLLSGDLHHDGWVVMDAEGLRYYVQLSTFVIFK